VDIVAGGGFVGRCYTIFEIVGYGVDGEGVGFLKEFGGGGGDFVCISRVVVNRRRGDIP
jgi:hypothetical protein